VHTNVFNQKMTGRGTWGSSSSAASLLMANSGEDRGRRRGIRLLLSSETCFAALMQFGVDRYVNPSHVSSAKVLSPQDHKTMFQNAEQVSFSSSALD
jgi:hypothetical protein